jgi:hypothetical protein
MVFFVAKNNKVCKGLIPLPKPISMFIRSNRFPFVGLLKTCNITETFYLEQLLFSGKVIANIMEMDLSMLFGCFVFDQQCYCDWRTTATSENLTALPT